MKKCILIFLICILTLSCVFASDAYYTKGDTLFSFRVGAVVPSFLSFFNNDDVGFVSGAKEMHSKIGLTASLSYQSFINSQWALGGELGYNFVSSNSSYNFTTIPLTVKATYTPYQTGKWDLKFNMNAGIAILKYDNNRYLSPLYVSASVNPVYYFGNSWGVGIEAGFYSNIEYYSSAQGKKNESCIAGFVPLSLTLCYRH